jgi:hypothetical protein
MMYAASGVSLKKKALRTGAELMANGDPGLNDKMPLKAQEQGYSGKKVQHEDGKTAGADWQNEYGHESEEDKKKRKAKKAGAVLKSMKTIVAKSLSAAGLPDPMCKTGVISLKAGDQPQSCCAGYCGECTDYPTCKSVHGQDSADACCASKVYEMRCGKAPANVCLKTCSEAVPPCIMDKDEIVIETPKRNAADNCTKAIPDWRAKAENAIAAGKKVKK